MINGNCKLCNKSAPLQESHIIPKFVFRWMKNSSGGVPLRFGENPNKRVQDGFKAKWLCLNCEQLFSKWETKFCNEFFHPYNENQSLRFEYQNWLLLFCVSLSWRVLNMYLDHESCDFNKTQMDLALKANEQWKNFLLGKAETPSIFEQHLLPVGIINSTMLDMPSNMNRYLTRGVDTDFGHSEDGDTNFIYTKIGPVIIVGFISMPARHVWRGAKIKVNRGYINPRQYVLPHTFGKFLFSKAQRFQDIYSKISKNQQAKIDKNVIDNFEEISSTGFFDAMEQDYKMFGEDSFKKQ